MKYLKDIIKSLFIISNAYIIYVIFSKCFNIFSEFKIIYIFLILILIIYINLENIYTIFNKSSEEKNNELFNIYYVNFPKVYEIAMLIDNKLKTLIEKNTKDENTMNISSKFNFKHPNAILTPALELNSDNRTLKSIEYKEVKEVKNTNSTILKIVKEKARKITKLTDINIGELIQIDNVEISIMNKDEILQVNSMVSGALKDNVINADADGQNLKIDLNALSSIFLKDYKYQLHCKTINNDNFYISIPMKLEKEFENDYSILDLEIGKVNILGIYRDTKYRPSKKSSWNIIQEENNNGDNQLSQMKDSNSKNSPQISNIEFEEYPYIDLIAILQEINIKEVNNE